MIAAVIVLVLAYGWVTGWFFYKAGVQDGRRRERDRWAQRLDAYNDNQDDGFEWQWPTLLHEEVADARPPE